MRQTRDLAIYISLTKDISTYLSLYIYIFTSTCQLPKKFNPFVRNKTHQTRIYTLGNVISAALLKVRFFQACSKHFRKQRQSATTNGIQFPRIKIQSPSSVSRILHTSKHDHDLSRKKKKKRRGGKGEKREKKRGRERERSLFRCIGPLITHDPRKSGTNMCAMLQRNQTKKSGWSMSAAPKCTHSRSRLHPIDRVHTYHPPLPLCKVFPIHRS